MHHIKAKFFKVTKTKGTFKIPQILIEDIQRNGKISHALGLEELVLLKWTYTQSSLQTYCDPYQITHDTFHRTRRNNPKSYMEPQETQNCQSDPEEKERSWRHDPLGLQTILQIYSKNPLDFVKYLLHCISEALIWEGSLMWELLNITHAQVQNDNNNSVETVGRVLKKTKNRTTI